MIIKKISCLKLELKKFNLKMKELPVRLTTVQESFNETKNSSYLGVAILNCISPLTSLLLKVKGQPRRASKWSSLNKVLKAEFPSGNFPNEQFPSSEAFWGCKEGGGTLQLRWIHNIHQHLTLVYSLQRLSRVPAIIVEIWSALRGFPLFFFFKNSQNIFFQAIILIQQRRLAISILIYIKLINIINTHEHRSTYKYNEDDFRF